MADSRLAPSQWETSLQSNAVSHWLGPNLESTLLISSYLFHTDTWQNSTQELPYWFCVQWAAQVTSMGKCKKDITPLLTHWSCIFLALTHRHGEKLQQATVGKVYVLGLVNWSPRSVIHATSNGMLPDGTKPLPELMLTYRYCHLNSQEQVNKNVNLFFF